MCVTILDFSLSKMSKQGLFAVCGKCFLSNFCPGFAGVGPSRETRAQGAQDVDPVVAQRHSQVSPTPLLSPVIVLFQSMDNTKEQPLLSAEPVRSRGKLPLSTKLLYALPTLGTASIIVVISTSLLTVYNDRNVTVSFIAITQFVAGLVASYLQVTMVWCGVVCMWDESSRMWRRGWQLILGYLGDRTTSRFGRRRPYMLFGAPFVAVAVVMLYLPVGNHRGFNSAWYVCR
mgnify:CR=1 FL=1